MLYDSLKANNIFLLPGQEELKISPGVMDGLLYLLTLKAGKSFRSYRFNNPEFYLQQYPTIKEFREYAAIVKHLSSLFK